MPSSAFSLYTSLFRHRLCDQLRDGSSLLLLGKTLLLASLTSSLLLARPSWAQSSYPGIAIWSENLGGTNSTAYRRSVATGLDGAAVVTGEFHQNVYLGGQCFALGHGNEADAFVAKFSSAGVCEWTHAYRDSHEQFGEGVAVDSIGNIFVVGSFAGVMDFGCRQPLWSIGARNIRPM